MRRYYLVCYDVSDEKRLRKVHKAMLGYGDPLQYSVFRCLLSYKEKAIMIARMTELLNLREDRLLVVDLGPLGEQVEERFEVLGTPLCDLGLPRTVVV